VTSQRDMTSQVVPFIGYGIDIGDDNSYVTLAKQTFAYFSLGAEPSRWLVDAFPFRAQFPAQITWW